MKRKVEIPKERILMGRDDSKIQEYADDLQALAEAANYCLGHYMALNIGGLTKQELIQLVKGSKTADALVREKLVGTKHVEVQGLTLDVEALKKLVVVPNLAGFEAAIRTLKEQNRIASVGSRDRVNINAVEIADGVASCDAAVARWQESYSSYAESDDEKEAYLILLQVQEQLQYLSDKHGISVIDHTSEEACILTQKSAHGFKVQVNSRRLKSKLSR